jgi:hypothetical protein
MKLNHTIIGDSLAVLKTLPDESVNCCVTSPPYWQLRDYEHPDQLGLEKTPEEYVRKLVDIFREVKRVLKKDGTLWLVISDTYAAYWGEKYVKPNSFGKTRNLNHTKGTPPKKESCDFSNSIFKPKDLIGIPWAVATGLRNPYYTGRIKVEKDMTWMAAMIDGEGTICGFKHTRKDDGRTRTGINICVTNSNINLLDECYRIWPVSRREHNTHGKGHYGSRPIYRWIVHGIENKLLFLRENCITYKFSHNL